MTANEVMGLKSKIKEAELAIAKEEGSLSALIQTLKDQFDCETEEDAVKKLEELQSALAIKQKRLDDGLVEIGKTLNDNA